MGTVESINMRGGPLPYTGKNLALPWVYALKARSHQRFSASRKMKDEKNELKNELKYELKRKKIYN
jgi:hypothetical protein